MRRVGLWLLSLAGSACTAPNPAWLATESSGVTASGPSTAEATGEATGAETGAVTEATTTATATTGGGPTGTGDPSTGAVSGATEEGSSGAPGTTGGEACAFAEAPDLSMRYTTSIPTGCMPDSTRQVVAEVLGQAGPNQWKFNVCGDEGLCKNPDVKCADGEHVIFTLDGAPEVLPTFTVGDCYVVHVVARGPDPLEPSACALRLLRLAHTRYTPAVNHFIGAIATPGTASLPGPGDWKAALGFELSSDNVLACEDPLHCMPPVGAYQFVVQWGPMATQHTAVEGMTFQETIKVLDAGQKETSVSGTFTAVRARIGLGACGTAQDFKWAWRAELP